jgi:predicted nuclease of predicted toxin-antitoxin system
VRLFISLYLDEDVSVLVARLIRSRGFSALTALEADQLGKTDAEQLEYAAQRNMAILTHNRGDFEALARQYVAAGQTHGGIFIAVRRTSHEIARRLLVLLNQITADEMDNQIFYI